MLMHPIRRVNHLFTAINNMDSEYKWMYSGEIMSLSYDRSLNGLQSSRSCSRVRLLDCFSRRLRGGSGD